MLPSHGMSYVGGAGKGLDAGFEYKPAAPQASPLLRVVSALVEAVPDVQIVDHALQMCRNHRQELHLLVFVSPSKTLTI